MADNLRIGERVRFVVCIRYVSNNVTSNSAYFTFDGTLDHLTPGRKPEARFLDVRLVPRVKPAEPEKRPEVLAFVSRGRTTVRLLRSEGLLRKQGAWRRAPV